MPEKVVIDGHELWHGDCREVLPLLAPVDLVLTDPPYGIGADRTRNTPKDGWVDYGFEGWDKERPSPWLFGLMREKAKECVVWGGNYFTDLLPPSMRWLVWDKGGAVGGGGDVRTCWKQTWELIQVAKNGPLYGPRDESVIRWPVTPADSVLHSCQKPVGLMGYLLNKLGPLRPVDPFMGSGSTGVACVQAGRQFVGIEIDRAHFETACERIARAQAQGQLLPPEPVAAPEQQTMEL